MMLTVLHNKITLIWITGIFIDSVNSVPKSKKPDQAGQSQMEHQHTLTNEKPVLEHVTRDQSQIIT